MAVHVWHLQVNQGRPNRSCFKHSMLANSGQKVASIWPGDAEMYTTNGGGVLRVWQ